VPCCTSGSPCRVFIRLCRLQCSRSTARAGAPGRRKEAKSRKVPKLQELVSGLTWAPEIHRNISEKYCGGFQVRYGPNLSKVSLTGVNGNSGSSCFRENLSLTKALWRSAQNARNNLQRRCLIAPPALYEGQRLFRRVTDSTLQFCGSGFYSFPAAAKACTR